MTTLKLPLWGQQESWQMQELKDRLGMGARLESSLLGMAGHSHRGGTSSNNSDRSEPMVVGSRVHVIRGRRFEDFGSGDVGTILHVDEEANTCSVAFDCLYEPRQVALRHLQVERAASRLPTKGLQERSAAAEPTSPTSPVALENAGLHSEPLASECSAGGVGHQIAGAPKPLATASSPPHVLHEGDSGPKSSSSTRRSRPMVPPLVLPPNGERECRKYSENSPRSGGLDMVHQVTAESAFSKPALPSPGLFDLDPYVAISSGPANNTLTSTAQSPRQPVNQKGTWELQLQELDGRLHRLFHSHLESASRLNALTEQVSLLSESLSACPARIDTMATRITDLASLCQNIADGKHVAVARGGMCDEHAQRLLHDSCEQFLADVHRRLDASDSRSEVFFQDLRDLRTLLNTSLTKTAEEHSKLDSLLLRVETQHEGSRVEGKPLEEPDQSVLLKSQDHLHAELKNLVVAVSQRAQEASDLSQNAMDLVKDDAVVVEQLKLRLTEIGQWANEAIVAGQRLENDVSAQSEAAAERWRRLEVLEFRVQEHIHCSSVKQGAMDALAKRVDDIYCSSAKHEAIDALAKRVDDIHYSSVNCDVIDALAKRVDDIHFSSVKHDAINALVQRVDDLGEVGQRANEAIRLGHELQEAVAAQRVTNKDNLANLEGSSRDRTDVYPSLLGFDKADPCTLAVKGSDACGVVNQNMLQQCVETVVEADLIAREAREMGQKLSEDLKLQKEAFETHSTISREKFKFLDELSSRLESFGATFASESQLREAATVRIEERCQQATQKLAATLVEKSSAIDGSAIAQQFQAMLAEVRSDAARAETCRRQDLESALSILRSEFDSFNDGQRRISPTNDAHKKADTDRSPSRWLTSNHPSPAATPTSGLLAPSPGVVRTSSAPVRERPTVVTSMPALVPRTCVHGIHTPNEVPPWPSTSHLQVARPLGPQRSARHSSPTRHVMLTTPSASPRSLSPTRGYVQPVGQVLNTSLTPAPLAQAIPTVASKVTAVTTTSRGATSTVCTVCGNMCMDDTSMCRRCTLNSHRVGSSNIAAPFSIAAQREKKKT